MKANYVLELLIAGQIDALKEAAEKEIREQAYKQAGGDKGKLSAIRKFANQTKKLHSDLGRRGIDGAWVENGKMCIVDGHSAYRFNQVYPDVAMASDGNRFDLDTVMKPQGDVYHVKAVDILEGYAKAKAEAKAAGIPWSKAKLDRPVLMVGSCWNVEFLATFARIMGDCDITKAGELSPLYANNETGECVVLPIHPKAAPKAVLEIPVERRG